LTTAPAPPPATPPWELLSLEELRELLAVATPAEAAELQALMEAEWLERRRRVWRSDPVAWSGERLGVFTWSKQAEILAAIPQHRRVSVPSCHGPGKDFTASVAACWWIDVHPPGEAFVVSTAPTEPQVAGILWREINARNTWAPYNGVRANLPGRLNLKDWYIGNQLVAIGRKPTDYAVTDSGTIPQFQGIHARNLLVIIDEADGIPQTLWTALSTLGTNEGARMLAIGNPDTSGTPFDRANQPGSGWHVIRIPLWATPNFTGEPVPADVGMSLVGRTWLEETERDYGRGSAYWSSKVEAESPGDDPSVQVVPGSYIKRARETTREWPEEALAVVTLGVDVGAGGDESVLREMRGPVAGRVWRSRHKDPERLMGEIMHAARETGATAINVDAIGIGWGITGWLKSLQVKAHTARINPVVVSEEATEPEKYANLRSQLWWMAREKCRLGLWDLSGLDDQTISELQAPRYAHDLHGRIKVEPKDDTKARLGRSPDNADALILAAHRPVAAYPTRFRTRRTA
jgi:hypothetical protein